MSWRDTRCITSPGKGRAGVSDADECGGIGTDATAAVVFLSNRGAREAAASQ